MKSTELVKIDPKTTALRIVEALGGGLVKAAEVYRKFVADGGDPMELRRYVPISADMWRTLDDLGSGRLDVRLAVTPSRVFSAARLLPKVTQSALLDNGVEVVAVDGSTMRVPLTEVTSAQAAQLFGPDGVRSPSAQAAWIKANTASMCLPKSPPVQCEVKGGKLRVYVPREFTVKEIHQYLAQME